MLNIDIINIFVFFATQLNVTNVKKLQNNLFLLIKKIFEASCGAGALVVGAI